MEEDEEEADGLKPADLKVSRGIRMFSAFGRPQLSSRTAADLRVAPCVQVILLGDSAVGKSKLVERFLMDDYHPRQVRATAAVAAPLPSLPSPSPAPASPCAEIHVCTDIVSV